MAVCTDPVTLHLTNAELQQIERGLRLDAAVHEGYASMERQAGNTEASRLLDDIALRSRTLAEVVQLHRTADYAPDGPAFAD